MVEHASSTNFYSGSLVSDKILITIQLREIEMIDSYSSWHLVHVLFSELEPLILMHL